MIVFASKYRSEIKRMHPTASMMEIAKLLGEGWAKLSQEEKLQFRSRESDLKEERKKRKLEPVSQCHDLSDDRRNSNSDIYEYFWNAEKIKCPKNSLEI